MAAVVVASGYTDKCIINSSGPIKMEFVPISSMATGDTYVSRLQNPQYAGFVPTAVNAISEPYCSVSGKTVTITNLGGATTGFLLIFGY